MNDLVLLKIADNGNGFWEDDKPADNNSIGIEIIKALLEQIMGAVLINSNKGTEYIIRFPFEKE